MNLVGKVLANRYEIIEEIGSGGMAVVYKARCRLLNRFVAIKVLRPDLQNDEEFVRRFNVEAQAAASLTHPNIVSIYDVGNQDGLHYIVMEYVEGETLKDYLDKKHVLPWREAAEYAIQILRGLEQAHKNSIIHRDIKPHNIIMTSDGVLKVTDFGIARASVQSTMTCDNSAIGSVHYISPEQARGGYTDERSDLYSLGIVLYEMLTGVVPFDNESPVTIAIKHIQEKPVPPREHNISIPLSLEKVVLKAIAKEVSARYRSASEMIADIKNILDDPAYVIHDAEEPKKEYETGSTIKMDAVDDAVIEKHDRESHVHEEHKTEHEHNGREVEEEMNKKTPKRRNSRGEIDKKKEKKVVAVAIICAVLLICLIGAAFMSLMGFGGIFGSSDKESVPRLEGMLYDDAVEKYKDSGFSIVKGAVAESDKEEGTILSQEPEAGSKVKKSDEIVITVTISEGSSDITLKNYTRYNDTRKAEIELNKLGLEAEFVDEYDDTIPSGSIISQSPKAGSKVKKGDVITFKVSKGPEDKKTEEPASGNEDGKKDEKPASSGNTTTGSENGNNNSHTGAEGAGTGTSATTEKKKSTMLTLYGPKDKDSALVQVNVNGRTVYSKSLTRGSSDVVKLEGKSDSVEVEIFYDGVSQQKSTVNLY